MTQDIPLFHPGREPEVESNVPFDVVPLGRTGTREDAAGAILFLASRAGTYCNGNVVVLDSGRLARLSSVYYVENGPSYHLSLVKGYWTWILDEVLA